MSARATLVARECSTCLDFEVVKFRVRYLGERTRLILVAFASLQACRWGYEVSDFTDQSTIAGNSAQSGGSGWGGSHAAGMLSASAGRLYNTTRPSSATTAIGGATTAIGGATTAIGGATTAIGGATTAIGGATTAIGGATTAIGGATTGGSITARG